MQHLQKTGGDAVASHCSYLNTGTLTRLISFVSHSYANTGGVGVFFPFWNALARPLSLAGTNTSVPALSLLTAANCKLTTFSVQSGNGFALLPATMQIVHGDIQVNLSARRLDANHKSFGVGAACQSRFVHVDFRGKHFEMKSLVVEQRHRIAYDHVRHFANRFFHHLLAGFDFRACKLTGHFHRHFLREVENHAAFNIALDGDERRDTFATIGILVHREVHDIRGRLQRLRENRVRGADERLDQFHSHERCSPASATGVPAALGSSLSTYRRISCNTSGFTGFCTKCFAPFCSAARMFSWYPTEETMTMRALACCRTMRSTASIPSICGMVMSISTMSGLVRLNSAMAVRPSPASPATSPPNISIILMRFLRAKTESSTTR